MPENIFLLILIFAASLWVLMRGADDLVDGSSAIATRMGISNLVIGLTVIALGTSLPELVVSIQAALAGQGQMAMSNVVGSNITNIALVLGTTAIVSPLAAPDRLRKDLPFKLLLSMVFLGMIAITTNVLVINNIEDTSARLERWGGIALLVFFAIFIGRLFFIKDTIEDPIDGPAPKVLGAAFKTILGTALIIIGGKYTVDSAVGIARTMAISESTIGLTIVAFGTSLPELVASITAARKGFADMAVGNVVGSNIMNLTLVLGTAGVIAPIDLGPYETLDITIMTLLTILFLAVISRRRTVHITRTIGATWVVGYFVYMGFIAYRSLV